MFFFVSRFFTWVLFVQSATTWLAETLKTLPTKTPSGAVTVTAAQLQDFHDLVCG